MKIEKIIVIRETIHFFSIPESEDEGIGPDDGLFSGLLSAIRSFSEEVHRENFYSYLTENHRVTLLKGNSNMYVAIISDEKSLEKVPEIITNYLFDENTEKIDQDVLKNKLEWIFFPKLNPELQKRGLLITVGKTTAPIWYAISRHSPEYVTFIVSEQTKSIALELIKFFGYELEINTKIFSCDPNDTTSIGEAGLKAKDFFSDIGLRNEEILFNSTGGTKAMPIAVSHISFIDNVPTYYVHSERARTEQADKIYSDEEILLLDNPSDSLGISLEKNAKTAFNSLIFLKAAEYFKKLESVFDANKRLIYRALHELSLAYENWDLFNFNQAVYHLENSVKIMKDNLKSSFGRQYQGIFDRINEQLKILEKLKKQNFNDLESIAEETSLILYFELINNAIRKSRSKKFDDAVARFYRIFEATSQLLLWKQYKINTSKFEEQAKNLPLNAKKMFRKKPIQTPLFIINLISRLFSPTSFPKTIALKNSWQLLEELDPRIKNDKLLSEIESILPVRNLSILAHGWNPIKEKTIEKFKKVIHSCIKLVQNAYKDNLNVMALQEILEFVEL